MIEFVRRSIVYVVPMVLVVSAHVAWLWLAR